ncbi:ATP-dependent RNA helicase ROK1 [Spathaspora passalidarum NRRL Y-27907]|uniref:RNA helicase n=1 Tax=Spathaspora passalidarum (strain NRRL Y-27907 / 11-Y1) TaxID=619300 RepID=G3ANB4_SPAPN|nr:ATP-dependent RNA helicase ROK1 [Spathaspora passalidarum NRRL Y-27907]EGW32497.1 ATP-dependent RNA helicase ROK1 [Spathaspora passalidarum NRRL Y-27907]
MDIFRILTRGASLNKKKNVTTDHTLPKNTKNSHEKHKEETLHNQVERETDFFHTRKHSKPEEENKQETTEEKEDEDETPLLEINSEEDAQKFRKSHKSKVTGDDIPLPIGSFQDMIGRFNIDKKLLTNLLAAEFVEPTAIQCESIAISLSNRDLIACAPTGSGKTLAFLIPLIQKIITEPVGKNHGIRGLIISPTNELAHQIFNQLEAITKGYSKRLNCAILSKQLANKLNNKIINSSKYDIIVTTPLRLIDIVHNQAIDLSKVSNLIIDEADKLFDHGFAEQTDEILTHCTFPHIQKSMFSATIPSGVEEMAHSIMKDPIRVIIGHKEAANVTIDQKLVFTGNEQGKLLAIRQMIQQGQFKPPIIIFLQSITRAKALFHELLYDRLNVDVIHAERTPKQREEVINRFKSGDIWVLITTDVLARGVDFKGVNMVINYDVPQTAQAYVHRIGRTGRGGKTGTAVTFFTKEDDQLVKPIINVMKQSGCESGYSEWMEDMGKLSKKDKQKLKTHEVTRKQISTVPKVMKQKRKQRQQMIEASKKEKARY